VAGGGAAGLALAAARAFLGRQDVSGDILGRVRLPGRLEHRPGEVRDGAHNPAGVRWLVEHLPPGHYTVMASILADKDVDEMLTRLAGLGGRFVATTSSSPRALPSAELAGRAARWFGCVEARDDQREALALAHALGEPVLVTGSLYLLADLAAAEEAS
jgi:dihydrofolate synthase / folylpolyglutamate synthase